jgi:hypothetical protein
LELFEASAKSLAEKEGFSTKISDKKAGIKTKSLSGKSSSEDEVDEEKKEIMRKMESLAEQNKTIARALLMMYEDESSEHQPKTTLKHHPTIPSSIQKPSIQKTKAMGLAGVPKISGKGIGSTQEITPSDSDSSLQKSKFRPSPS